MPTKVITSDDHDDMKRRAQQEWQRLSGMGHHVCKVKVSRKDGVSTAEITYQEDAE